MYLLQLQRRLDLRRMLRQVALEGRLVYGLSYCASHLRGITKDELKSERREYSV